ncbi:hypothetical protein NEOLI_001010 [Neolecta irregularis DAH-3]|uniref:Methylosome subunit pICln n=1 Tax=Neolecta irregularis (strain DAH-3) TaxID=1198029 RepID=A0A1U7LVY3_NEOID|nr:hypothetical protein NEOLI_001010 [Neolecta irregularis DAH-3]|eukprot:OLL26827.1 hypothetical protein NEOLI_001010 [Neolecta irregularis DAH-3]
MFAPVSAPPADFISLEDCQAATPASFANAPAVLHCQTEAHIAVAPADFPLLKTGLHTVYVTSKTLILWSGDSGVEIIYRDITLHAIAPSPERHVYLQIAGEEEEENFVEVTITPKGGSDVDRIYDALCACAALHPDPQEDDNYRVESDSAEWITTNNQFDDVEEEDGEQPQSKWRRT